MSMPFAVEDFHDLVKLLGTHPEWRQDLRRLVLTDDILALPGLVGESVVAQRRAGEQIAALATQVAALAAAQQRTEVRVSRVDGLVLEQRFAERAPAYLGAHGFRRARVVATADWVDLLDGAAEEGRLSASDRDELLRADTVLRARDAQGDVWLAAEVSVTVDVHDIARARRRASALGRLQARGRLRRRPRVYDRGGRGFGVGRYRGGGSLA